MNARCVAAILAVVAATTIGALLAPARAAWRPPPRLPTSEWASRHYRIVSKDAAQPGPWRFRKAPYLREIIDTCGLPDVDIVVLQCAARVGKSESVNIVVSERVDQDPGPFLLVYPNEPSTKERLRFELRPLFERNQHMRRHLPGGRWSLTDDALDLVECRIYPGWAGSPQALASRAIRYAVLEEIEKWPRFSGRDASPVALAKRRTENYQHRKLILCVSTPTTRDGAIAREVADSVDRRRYHVRCPECGALQELAPDRLRWPGHPESDDPDTRDPRERANDVQVEQSAWWECVEGCRIDERHKRRIVQEEHGACWVSEGYAPGERPASRRVAFTELGLQYSQLGGSWSDIAAQWILAEGDTGKLYELWTQVFGRTYDSARDAVDVEAIRDQARATQHQARVAPDWCASVLLTVDTQSDHFWYVARAWNADYSRSRKLEHGKVASLTHLEALEARQYPTESGEQRGVALVGIDSGGAVDIDDQSTTTDMVYRWCSQRPRQRLAFKGWGGSKRPEKPVTVKSVEPRRMHRAHARAGVALYVIDTHHYKDRLSDLVRPDSDTWEPGDVDQTYLDHMGGERKVTTLSKTTKAMETRWEPIAVGRRIDLKDCEGYQLALADIARSGNVRSAPPKPKDYFAARRAARGARR